jgi:hypothetical protein
MDLVALAARALRGEGDDAEAARDALRARGVAEPERLARILA